LKSRARLASLGQITKEISPNSRVVGQGQALKRKVIVGTVVKLGARLALLGGKTKEIL
jgi:hypothetical protein